MGGENWETRRGRSRAGLLRSPRDLHLDLATFGARPSLRNFAPLSALLGTALAGEDSGKCVCGVCVGRLAATAWSKIEDIYSDTP